jgi:hypothetical protein
MEVGKKWKRARVGRQDAGVEVLRFAHGEDALFCVSGMARV